VARPVPKKAVTAAKPENRLVQYWREVRAEIRRVTWPSRRVAINLTLIVLGVTLAASVAMGVVDWVFAQLFALLVG
jgi:preprotein translocase subunit SecE